VREREVGARQGDGGGLVENGEDGEIWGGCKLKGEGFWFRLASAFLFVVTG
jgi:hypothetical protein